jgi:hypothetical protein
LIEIEMRELDQLFSGASGASCFASAPLSVRLLRPHSLTTLSLMLGFRQNS